MDLDRIASGSKWHTCTLLSPGQSGFYFIKILIFIMIVSFSQWSNGGKILSKFPIAHRGTNLVCMVCLQEEFYDFMILSYFFLQAYHAY